MKNLKVYQDDSIDVHLTAVSRKDTSDSKKRLISIENNIRADYDNYELQFSNKCVEKISKNKFYLTYKPDLHSLYEFQNETIREVRGEIEKIQERTIRYTCQNCTINSANTLDHVLPQGDFPEFVVNPKNLFPCCSECNSYKSHFIEKDGNRLFLNLYLDDLPNKQYLFVDFDFDDSGEIDFRYSLKNLFGIDSQIFSLIESHYAKLHLFERMRKKANNDYSEIENSILNKLDNLSLDTIFEEFRKNIIDDQKAYGFNHWKCILKLTIITDRRYKEYIEEKFKERTRAYTSL